jgi:hypothetical protein
MSQAGSKKPAPNRKRQNREMWDRRFGVLAVILIIAAWIIGNLSIPSEPAECDLAVLPGATACRTVMEDLFEGIRVEEDGSETIVGWASVASAAGYAGDIEVMVGINPAGEVLGVTIIDQVETPSFFQRIENNTLLDDYAGMAATSPFQLGEDVDAVSRATVSSAAITTAVREASYTIAEQQLGLTVEHEDIPIVFGIPEALLIALYAAGFFGHQRKFKYKKQLRWATMLIGLVALGFVYNAPLTLSHFNRLLLGAWPDWRTNLYWFLLVGGVLLVVTADNKNPYCSWFCPFGAAQECLGVIGRARYVQPKRGKEILKWIPRVLTLSAILLALVLRNPGISSYEIFGTLFAFNGASVQWAILVIILLMSMFVRRPWCHFLCPMDPIVDFIHAGRRWIKELWPTRKPQPHADTPISPLSSSSDSASS